MPTPPMTKKKKYPSWYYVAGAAGLAAVYFLYAKNKAAAAASAAATNASTSATPTAGDASTVGTAGTAAGSYGGYTGSYTPDNSGELSEILSAIQTLQPPAGTTTPTSPIMSPPNIPVTTPTTPAGSTVPPAGNTGTGTSSGTGWSAPTGEILQGGGYVYQSGSPTPITGSDGSQYSYISTPAQLSSIAQTGATIYFQPLPGVFMPVSGTLPQYTPQYAKVA